MSSISPGLGSGRGERVDEMWQNVQETLREQRYPVDSLTLGVLKIILINDDD